MLCYGFHDKYAAEWDADFDLKEDEAAQMLRDYVRLDGWITFFMDECPGCGQTMPFEFDEGRCMKCKCDPCAGVIDEMSEREFEMLIENNRYHIEVPKLPRMPFETLPQLVQRQVDLRVRTALEKYKKENGDNQNKRRDRGTDRKGD